MTPRTTWPHLQVRRTVQIMNSFRPARSNTTPSRPPTVAIDVVSNRRTMSAMITHAIPVIRNNHQMPVISPNIPPNLDCAGARRLISGPPSPRFLATTLLSRAGSTLPLQGAARLFSPTGRTSVLPGGTPRGPDDARTTLPGLLQGSPDHAQVMQRVGDHHHVVSRGGMRFVVGHVRLQGELVLYEHPNERLRLFADPTRVNVGEESHHVIDVGLAPVALHDGAAVFESHENRTDGGFLPLAHASPSDQAPCAARAVLNDPASILPTSAIERGRGFAFSLLLATIRLGGATRHIPNQGTTESFRC